MKKKMASLIRWLTSYGEEPTLWNMNDQEICDALERYIAEKRAACDIDFTASPVGRWDHGLHVEAFIDRGFPKHLDDGSNNGKGTKNRIILYFPGQTARHKKILRIHGLKNSGKLQTEICERLQTSTEMKCRLVVYLNESGALYRCFRHGNYIELRWASSVGTSLGAHNATVLRRPAPIISEQDGQSNTRSMWMLVAEQPFPTRGVMLMHRPVIKWPIGERMTANMRPAPPPKRVPELQSEQMARYDISSMATRSAKALRPTSLFDSASGSEDAEDDDEYTGGRGDDAQTSTDAEFGDLLVEDDYDGVGDHSALNAVDTSGRARGHMGVDAVPLVDMSGINSGSAVIAYDARHNALAEIHPEKEYNDDPFATSSSE